MTFGFKGAANITHVRTYVDNKVNFDFSPSPGQQSIEGQGSPTTPGNHTLTVVAWDAQGHVYSSKVGFTAFYDMVAARPKATSACRASTPTVLLMAPM